MDKTFKDIKISKKIKLVKKNEKDLINFYKKNFVEYHKEFNKVYNNYLESLKNIDESIDNFNSLETTIKKNLPKSLKPTTVKNKDIDNFISPNNNLLLNSYFITEDTSIKEFIEQHIKNQITYYINKKFSELNNIISSYDVLIGRDVNVHGKNSNVDYIQNIDFRNDNATSGSNSSSNNTNYSKQFSDMEKENVILKQDKRNLADENIRLDYALQAMTKKCKDHMDELLAVEAERDRLKLAMEENDQNILVNGYFDNGSSK